MPSGEEDAFCIVGMGSSALAHNTKRCLTKHHGKIAQSLKFYALNGPLPRLKHMLDRLHLGNDIRLSHKPFR